MPNYFDWLLGASTITSIYLLGQKQWQGWVLTLVNNSVLFPILNVHNRNYGLLPLDLVSVIVAARALYLWKFRLVGKRGK